LRKRRRQAPEQTRKRVKKSCAWLDGGVLKFRVNTISKIIINRFFFGLKKQQLPASGCGVAFFFRGVCLAAYLHVLRGYVNVVKEPRRRRRLGAEEPKRVLRVGSGPRPGPGPVAPPRAVV
jgi:hypothetical protein